MGKLSSEIESIDLKEESAYEHLLAKLEALAQFSFPEIELLPDQDMYIVRARQLENESEFFTQISEHSYFPDEKSIKQGRLNLPGQIIFYARSDFYGALAECQFMSKKHVGEKVSFAFSQWQLSRKLKFIVLLNPEDMTLSSKDRKTDYVSQCITQYEAMLEDQGEEHHAILGYLAKKLREPIPPSEKYRYKLTSAIANFVFDTHQDIGGLIYQSVQFPDRYNFAIQKRGIDEGYFLPVHFSKGTYLIGENELKELDFQEAKSFDRVTGKVKW